MPARREGDDMNEGGSAVTVVVGADSGIGEAFALAVNGRGRSVVAACLGEAPTLKAAGIEVLPGVDVTSDDAVARLSRALDSSSVDLLMYVAGVVREAQFGSLDFAGMQEEYDVNAVGFLRVAQVVVPRMSAGGKVGLLTSRVGSLGDNGSGGTYGYRMSKAAADMAQALDPGHRAEATSDRGDGAPSRDSAESSRLRSWPDRRTGGRRRAAAVAADRAARRARRTHPRDHRHVPPRQRGGDALVATARQSNRPLNRERKRHDQDVRLHRRGGSPSAYVSKTICSALALKWLEHELVTLPNGDLSARLRRTKVAYRRRACIIVGTARS